MIERVAMTWLVNALWLVPLIAATTALCTGFGRLGPRARHGCWIAALALAVTLPALPAALFPAHPAAATRSQSAAPLPADETSAGAADRLFSVSTRPAAPRPLVAFDQTWTKAILSLAAVVVVVALLRLLTAIRAGRGLIRAARPCYVDPALERIVSRIAGQHSLPTPPILESETIASPVVVGAVRPAILLPPGFADLPWDEQRAAMLHEMAHVVRYDYAWNMLCEVVSLPLAWHPALLPIKAGIRRSRETACDALAAEAMTSRAAYAKCLVSLATRLGVSRPSSSVVVGLIGKSDLEERLVTLLKPRPNKGPAALRATAAVAMAAAVLAPACFLRVTPAFADEPVVARRVLVTAPLATAVAQSWAPAAAKPARMPAVVAAKRVASLDAVAPLPQLPAPPPPPAPLMVFPGAPPAPPAPPPPPAILPSNGFDVHEHIAHGRYDVIVRRALDRALSAERVKASDEMRQALADVRTHQLQILRAEEAKIHVEIAAAVAELDHEALGKTLDHVKSRLRSPEFRNATAATAHDSVGAAAEAQAREGNAGDGKEDHR